MDVACNVISEVLTEPSQLKMDSGLVIGGLDITTNIGIQQRFVTVQ